MKGVHVSEERRHDGRDPSPPNAQRSEANMSGLEIMRAIRDGALSGPPMARLIGFRCVEAEVGEVAMQLEYDPALENSMGMLHGGTAAAMLDTAMGAAAHTILPTGSAVVTLDLTLTYLRPVTVEDTPIIATGRVINQGRRTIYVVGELKDQRNRLMAHAVGNFSVIGNRRQGGV